MRGIPAPGCPMTTSWSPDVKNGYITLAAARATQADALDAAAPHLMAKTAALAERFTGPGPVFLGIGASYAAASGAVFAMRRRGIAALRLIAGEHPLPFATGGHPLFGISQSGKSAETLQAFESVAEAQRMALVNVSTSPIALRTKTVIGLGDIPDSYASTIGYTATVMALGMVAEAWDGGRIAASWRDIGNAVRALEAELGARAPAIAARLAAAPFADCVGIAPSVGAAEAGALLLREIARLPASAMSTRQYLHGAMESAGAGVHVVLGRERELQLAEMLADAGHDVVLVTPGAVAPRQHLMPIRLPALSDTQMPILEAVVMQTLAVETALARGLDPDAFVFENNDTKVGEEHK